MTREWDGRTYDRIAGPMQDMAAPVLARLELRGDETVLDAGCGTGRVTELLLGRLPRGRVLALDASGAMLEQARGRLARFGEQVTYVQADLERPLPVAEPVDAVLSTATFHWVLDHDALFANLASVLRPGARLVAQCGGDGNVATLLRVAKEIHPGFTRRHNFQTAEATRERLERSGFVEIDTWLSAAPTPFDSPEQFAAFLETVCLRTFLEELPQPEREPFVRAVAARIPELTLDYVRLNIIARRIR